MFLLVRTVFKNCARITPFKHLKIINVINFLIFYNHKFSKQISERNSNISVKIFKSQVLKKEC